MDAPGNVARIGDLSSVAFPDHRTRLLPSEWTFFGFLCLPGLASVVSSPADPSSSSEPSRMENRLAVLNVNKKTISNIVKHGEAIFKTATR